MSRWKWAMPQCEGAAAHSERKSAGPFLIYKLPLYSIQLNFRNLFRNTFTRPRVVQSPEIAEYPDTGGFGVLAEIAQKSNETARMLMFVGREQQSLNYWEEE